MEHDVCNLFLNGFKKMKVMNKYSHEERRDEANAAKCEKLVNLGKGHPEIL